MTDKYVHPFSLRNVGKYHFGNGSDTALLKVVKGVTVFVVVSPFGIYKLGIVYRVINSQPFGILDIPIFG